MKFASVRAVQGLSEGGEGSVKTSSSPFLLSNQWNKTGVRMAGFPLAAAITAGGGLVQGLLGKPKTVSPAQTIRSTVKGARQAGIHPLAALGASPQYTTVGGSGLGSSIGDGLTKAGAILANQKTEEEIAALKSQTDAQQAQAELFRAQSRSIIQNATAKGRGAFGGAGYDSLEGTNYLFGDNLNRKSKTSRAQKWEDDYGNIVGDVMGMLAFLGDGAIKTNEQMSIADKRLRDFLARKLKSAQSYSPRRQRGQIYMNASP